MDGRHGTWKEPKNTPAWGLAWSRRRGGHHVAREWDYDRRTPSRHGGHLGAYPAHPHPRPSARRRRAHKETLVREAGEPMEAGGDREGWGGGRSELWCDEVVGSGAFHPAGTSNTWPSSPDREKSRRCTGRGRCSVWKPRL
jgi:hypothetical protein